MTRHHIDHDLLVDYGTGSLPEALALVVATHIACCTQCRKEVAGIEDVGGALLAVTDEAPVSANAFAAILDRLDVAEEPVATPPLDATSRKVMPGPLARHVKRNLKDLRWRRIGPRIEEAVLATTTPGLKTALLRIGAGASVPVHTHGGREWTLVLQGGILDSGKEYRRGDVMAKGEDDEHQPVAANDEDCICLAVLDAPVRLTGRFGRLLNPFIRH